MTALSAINKWLCKVELFLGATCMCIMVAAIFMDILSRKFTGGSIRIAQELTIFLATWMFFLGASYLGKKNKLIKTDFFVKHLKGKYKALTEIIGGIFILIFISLLLYYGFKLQLIQYRHNSYTLDLPKNFFSLPVIYAGFSIGLGQIQFLSNSFSEIRDGARKEKQ